MSKKLICLVSFVLVLGLFMSGSAVAGDQNLVLWLKFEGNADDSSGYDNHGTLMGDVGNAKIVNDSMRGQVLETSGKGTGNPGFVDCGNSETLAVSTMAQNITVMCWLKSIGDGFIQNWGILVSKNSESTGWGLRRIKDSNFATFTIRGTSGGINPDGISNIADYEWHHITGTYNGVTRCLYVDGNVDFIIDDTGSITAAPNDKVIVGARCIAGSISRYIKARLDDVRIYSRALTAEEIQKAMIGVLHPPKTELALEPSPADEETGVPRQAVLNWAPGMYADKHDVYFGTNFDDVNDATTDSAVYQGRQSETIYAFDSLELGKTYYWRIDEVNVPPDLTIFKGNVWRFTIETVAYQLAGENITATASSSDVVKGPENTVNGSGLDDSGLLHGNIGVDSMWLSSMAGPQPAWIEFDLDKVYKLHEMWVWNFNDSLEPAVGFGLKDVIIEYSVDGAIWTTLGTTHEFARGPGTAGYANITTVDLGGVVAKYVKITANSNWGGIVPQYGLSEVRFFYVPVLAREPNPDSGTTDTNVDNVTLSWRAGREAASHDVYLSDSNQAVIDETIGPVTIPADSSYANYDTGPLDLDQTYYWKVNEVNEAETPNIWEGDVLNFTTREFRVVDDFENYNNFSPDRVFQRWIDGVGYSADEFFPVDNPGNGSGAALGHDIWSYDSPHYDGDIMETAIVHGGAQSAPLYYDNSIAPFTSEIDRTFDVPQDWTKHGIKTLSLWFYGDPNNVVQQMYVKVNGSKVVYAGDVADIQQASWKQWDIDLASFGVNLSNVTDLSIGFERSGVVGGTGVVYFDDIRLYPALVEE